MRWLFESCKSGKAITYPMVMCQFAKLDSMYAAKSKHTQCSIAVRFANRHRFGLWMKTTVAQKSVEEVELVGNAFIKMVKHMVVSSNRDSDFILNVDQTPCNFAMALNRTLGKKGKRLLTCVLTKIIRSVSQLQLL